MGARAALAALVALSTSCHVPDETEPHQLAFSVGPAGIDDNDETVARLGAQYRFGEFTSWRLIPAVAVAASDQSASFGSLEARRNFWLSPNWLITPSFGVGYFDEGNVLDLGGELQFRSGIELAYQLSGSGWRIGLSTFHLSNAGIFDSNPGTEVLALSVAIPLTWGEESP